MLTRLGIVWISVFGNIDNSSHTSINMKKFIRRGSRSKVDAGVEVKVKVELEVNEEFKQ